MAELSRYPMHTLSETHSSLELLKQDHAKSDIGVSEYRSIRDVLQSRIKELEAKEEK